MSADNGVYILETPKGNDAEFRVKMLFAIDNYLYNKETGNLSQNPKVQIVNARKMWAGCTVFDDYDEALKEAYSQVKEWDDFLEYGVCLISIDAEF